MIWLRFAVPVFLFGYFLWQARKSPVFVLGLPMLYCFGESIFIRTWGTNIQIPLLPVPLSREDIIFFGVAATWFYVRQKRRHCQALSFQLDFLVIGALLGFLLIQLPITWIAAKALKPGAIIAARYSFYLPLSFFLWADILRRFTRNEIWSLLSHFAVITLPLMGLYGLSAVGLDVYPQLPYQALCLGNAVIIRDFVTFPYWTKLALSFWLVRLIKRGGFGAIIAVLLLISGTALSLTRSYLLPVLCLIALAGFNALIRTGRVRRVWVLGMIPGSVIGAFFLLSTFAPANLAYLSERLSEWQDQGLFYANVNTRLQTLSASVDFMETVDPVFGLGFTGGGSQDSSLAPVSIWGDMMWFSIVVFLGWGGAIIFALILLIALWNSLRMTFHTDASRSQTGLLLLMIMIWDVVRTFASEGYLMFTAGAMFILALIAVEKRNLWAVKPATSPMLPFLSGINLNWLTQDDEFKPWRRLVLVALVGVIAIWLGIFVAK